jgi:hypothetical protein
MMRATSARPSRAVSDNWDATFIPAIPLPSGGQLVTFRDAGHYIDKLPKRHQADPLWQRAVKELLLAATDQVAWEFFARLSIMKALYRDRPATPVLTVNRRRRR